MTSEHPKIPLLFFVEGSKEAEFGAALMHETIDRLAGSRQWELAPPRFVNETEDSHGPGDLPLRTVGGILDLYSAFPPWDRQLPPEVDYRQLEDAEAVLNAMIKFSAETGDNVIFVYNGEDVGAIEAGVPDSGLTDGLFGEWRRTLATRSKGIE